jgi:hypothetical protein
LIGWYNLLCDDCNLLFRGFAVPGTVKSSRTKRKSRASSPAGPRDTEGI